MEPIAFVLAILGCGDDGGACVAARVEPARYASEVQCRAALPDALKRNTDLSYPVIAAACQASGPTIAQAKAPAPRG